MKEGLQPQPLRPKIERKRKRSGEEKRRAAVAVDILPDDALLSQVEPIREFPAVLQSINDLQEMVEYPVREACQILYNKNITTISSSGNQENIYDGAFIIIDYNSLSAKNKKIAQGLGKRFMMKDRDTIVLTVSTKNGENTTIGEVRKPFIELVSKFEQQY